MLKACLPIRERAHTHIQRCEWQCLGMFALGMLRLPLLAACVAVQQPALLVQRPQGLWSRWTWAELLRCLRWELASPNVNADHVDTSSRARPHVRASVLLKQRS